MDCEFKFVIEYFGDFIMMINIEFLCVIYKDLEWW